MLLEELEAVVRSRQGVDPRESYTARLLGDVELNQRKIMEEAFEVCLELGRPATSSSATAEEAADLLYHLVTGLVAAGVSVDEVATVLRERRT